jgi:hypothetical protein
MSVVCIMTRLRHQYFMNPVGGASVGEGAGCSGPGSVQHG